MSEPMVKTITDIFETVWEIEPASKPEIVQRSGWSLPTVEKVLALLQSKGEILCIPGRGGPQGTGSGRAPSLFMVTRTEAARNVAQQQSANARTSA